MNDILSQIIAYSPNKIDTETKARAMVQGPRNMYNQGQLVQPNADGSRPGYSGNKGYVKPLSPELEKLFNKTNPGEEWGKGKFSDERARGNWKNDAPRKQKILNTTSNLITQEELAKILTEELGEEISGLKIMGKYGVGQRTKFSEIIEDRLFKGTYGSIKGGKNVGGSLRYFKKPSKNDIKKILKSGTLGDVRINSLNTNTVKNIKYLNKKYGDIYKAGNIPDIKLVMKGTNMTEQSAGTATARLAQIYNGHKFNNENLKGIRVNKNTASKMFEIMDKSPFGNPYRNGLYKASLTTIDEKLGNETGTFESLKKKATKILKENKIPVYDFKKGKKAFGFNINEIAGVTGSAKSKAAEFSQFIDVMEGNLNQKTLANFQGQLSIARQNIEGDKSLLSSESKRINKLARNLEGQYDIELPRLRDPDATKYFSPKRIKELNAQGINVVKAAERAGYTVEMPKKAMTINEFIDPKNTDQIKTLLADLGCPKSLQKASGGRIKYNKGTSCAIKGREVLEKGLKNGFKESDQVLANTILKSGRFLKDMVSLRGLFGPAALALTALTEAGFVASDAISGGKSFREAIGDSAFNYLLGDKTKINSEEEFIKRIKNIPGSPSQGFRGVTDEDIGKMQYFKSIMNDIQTGSKNYNTIKDLEKKIEDNTLNQQVPEFSDQSFQLNTQLDKAQAENQDYFRTDKTGQIQNYFKPKEDGTIPAVQGAEALQKATLMAKQDQLNDAYRSSPKGLESLKKEKRDIAYELYKMNNPTKPTGYEDAVPSEMSYIMSKIKNEPNNNYGLFGPAKLMEGGIASLNVKK